MKAIMLCCDKYLISAYHTIKSYNYYLPNNNFTFVLPYNNEIPNFINDLKKELGNKLELIHIKKDKFKPTMETLLEKIGDEEYIYWCSSDNYLHRTINREKFMEIKDSVEKGFFKDYDAISITFNKRINKIKQSLAKININKMEFLLCPLWKAPIANVWNHQFMKCKILKSMWESFDEPNKAKELDYQLADLNHRIYKNPIFSNCRNIYLDEHIINLGENTSRGNFTNNAFLHFEKLKLDSSLIGMKVDKDKSIIW